METESEVQYEVRRMYKIYLKQAYLISRFATKKKDFADHTMKHLC
jgi:hypothetical protein